MKHATKMLLALAALVPITAQAETVNVPHFDGIELRGGGHVVLRQGPAQSVNLVKGNTQVTHFHIKDGHTLVIDLCEGQCTGPYELEVEITAPQISGVAVDGGGSIGTAGSFAAQPTMAAAINGGGNIDVHAINAASVEAAVNGGGKIDITATGSLTAAVRGGGNIAYRGHPQVTQAIAGGGSVERAD